MKAKVRQRDTAAAGLGFTTCSSDVTICMHRRCSDRPWLTESSGAVVLTLFVPFLAWLLKTRSIYEVHNLVRRDYSTHAHTHTQPHTRTHTHTHSHTHTHTHTHTRTRTHSHTRTHTHTHTQSHTQSLTNQPQIKRKKKCFNASLV